MIRTTFQQILGLVLLLFGYYSLAHYAGWPGPYGVVHAVGYEWNAGILPHDIEVSCARWVLGWIPGAGFGVALGLATGRIIAVRHTLEPFRLLLRALPFIGLVPIVIRLFGTSEDGKILLIAWVACSVCWPIVDTASAAIPPAMMWRAQTLGANVQDRVRIVWMCCQRAIYGALRTSLSITWIVVATVEMAGVFQRSAGDFWSEGLGYRLFRAQQEGQDGVLIGALLIFALVGSGGEILFAGVWHAILGTSLRLRQRHASRFIDALPALGNDSTMTWGGAGELEVRNLAASYNGSAVFSDCSFEVASGETLTVLGKSGSGKTTLLRIIANLMGQDLRVTGEVLIDKRRSNADQRIGIVFQDALVFSQMTVWENVVFGHRARTNPANAYRLLVQFGLDSLVTRIAETLSGGQRQRLALACALANFPQVLLLDEPFGALDAITRHQLQTQFRIQVRGFTTCLFVTHDLDEAIEVSSNRIMVGIGNQSEIVDIPSVQSRIADWKLQADYTHLRNHLFETLEG